MKKMSKATPPAAIPTMAPIGRRTPLDPDDVPLVAEGVPLVAEDVLFVSEGMEAEVL